MQEGPPGADLEQYPLVSFNSCVAAEKSHRLAQLLRPEQGIGGLGGRDQGAGGARQKGRCGGCSLIFRTSSAKGATIGSIIDEW